MSHDLFVGLMTLLGGCVAMLLIFDGVGRDS